MSSQTENCKWCDKNILTSTAELKVETCLSCMVASLQEREELAQVVAKLTKSNEELQVRLDTVTNIYNTLIDLHKAEQRGAEAAGRGLGSDQNPHVDNQEMSVMWQHGWIQRNVGFEIGKMRSVVIWSLTQLPIIEEIARIEDMLEVADKLQFVIEKLTPFVADLLEGNNLEEDVSA